MTRLLGNPRIVILLICLLVLAVLPYFATLWQSEFLYRVGTRIMIYAIAAVSLDLILGFGGMVSFGHAVFIGLGGYAIGILAFYGYTNGFLQFAVAIVGCAIFAALTGAICLRTGGLYFIMITLAFSQMLYYLGIGLQKFGGDDGFRVENSVFFPGFSLGNRLTLYYVTFVLLVGVLFGLSLMVNSRFGMVLRGAYSNERRMKAIGFPTFRYKLIAYIIAGAICGVAGGLFVNLMNFMTPAYMHWEQSGDLLVMIIVGGVATLFGGVIGSAVWVLSEIFMPIAIDAIFPGYGTQWKLVFGPLLILIVLFFKRGIFGSIPDRWRGGSAAASTSGGHH